MDEYFEHLKVFCFSKTMRKLEGCILKMVNCFLDHLIML